jgi:hypothetical protein
MSIREIEKGVQAEEDRLKGFRLKGFRLKAEVLGNLNHELLPSV